MSLEGCVALGLPAEAALCQAGGAGVGAAEAPWRVGVLAVVCFERASAASLEAVLKAANSGVVSEAAAWLRISASERGLASSAVWW